MYMMDGISEGNHFSNKLEITKLIIFYMPVTST